MKGAVTDRLQTRKLKKPQSKLTSWQPLLQSRRSMLRRCKPCWLSLKPK